ncbi:TorD/DmsD family molecular chaperone [Gleimia hominis]|uniref:TorD/DmsD family molecular chaperone n=1 Tax=Gleimia hominis TaxID=595468 RepID=UPI000C804291|nr:molecular chaperone TorD family protein [Gleimia hominis]WIK64797.1 molecular chaperone TorD family protein [Gleimia hominis]
MGTHLQNLSVTPVELAERLSTAGEVIAHLYLAPPSGVLVSSLMDPQMLDVWPLEDPTSQAGIVLLRTGADSLKQLQQDHLYLYIGVGPALAQPYESPYVSEEAIVFDTATLQVRAAYEKYGFQAPHLGTDPDDHIGLEIAFLAALAGKYAADGKAQPSLVRDAQAFFDQHLMAFAPKVIAASREHAQTQIYRALADLTEGFIEQYQHWLTQVSTQEPKQ